MLVVRCKLKGAYPRRAIIDRDGLSSLRVVYPLALLLSLPSLSSLRKPPVSRVEEEPPPPPPPPLPAG